MPNKNDLNDDMLIYIEITKENRMKRRLSPSPLFLRPPSKFPHRLTHQTGLQTECCKSQGFINGRPVSQ